ncbi:MAG: LysR family transcriptional regulator [Ilumatobacteraceae bacterium]
MTDAGIDLNLLRVLDALLENGSVAGAAKVLHLSPPAVSRSLARLRHVVGDPLFVRAGRSMVPTDVAISLREPARRALDAAVAVLRPSLSTDPGVIERRFTICADDAIVAALALPLITRLREEAPGVDIDFVSDVSDAIGRFRAATLDLRIDAHIDAHHDVVSEVILTDRFVAAVRDDHPLLSGRLTPQRYAAARHVTVSPKGKRRGPIDAALAELGLEREHTTTITSFVVAAHLVAATDLVGSLPSSVVSVMARTLPIRALEIPLTLPTFDLNLIWHVRDDLDAGHRWLRQQILEAFGEIQLKCDDPAVSSHPSQAKGRNKK